jgi:hypothetical protein
MNDDQLEPREKLELALLRGEHQKKFQMMINFIKEQVGEGEEYANAVARIVVSDNGAYYELLDLPEEFCGASGPGIELSFISQPDAVRLLEDAAAAAKSAASNPARQLQILALYTRRGLVDRKNCYVVNYLTGSKYRPGQNVTGAIKPGVMPLFFKIKLQTSSSELAARLRINQCILVCIITSGDRYPLVRIRLDGEHTTDMAALAQSRTIQ